MSPDPKSLFKIVNTAICCFDLVCDAVGEFRFSNLTKIAFLFP